MALTVADLLAKLRLDTSGFTEGLKSVETGTAKIKDSLGGAESATKKAGEAATAGGKNFKQLGDSLNDTTNKVRALITPTNLLGGAIGVGLVAAIKSAVSASTNYAEELVRLQQITGSSITRLAALTDIANDVGVSFDSLKRGLFLLANEADTAGSGLLRLGVRATDSSGAMKDGAALFLESALALGKLSTATERAQLARDLFGRSAAELLPVFEELIKRQGALGESTNLFSQAMSGGALAALHAYTIAQRQVSDAFLLIQIEITKALLPALKLLSDVLTATLTLFLQIPQPLRSIIILTTTLTAAVIALTVAFGLLKVALAAIGIPALIASLTGMGPTIAIVAGAVTLLVLAWEPLKALWSGIVSLATTVKDAIASVIPQPVIAAWEKFKQIVSDVRDIFQKFNPFKGSPEVTPEKGKPVFGQVQRDEALAALARQVGFERASIQAFEQGKALVLAMAALERKEAEETLKIKLRFAAADLEAVKDRNNAILLSEVNLAGALRKMSTQQATEAVAIANEQAKALMALKEQEKDAALAAFDAGQRLREQERDAFIISQADFVEQSVRAAGLARDAKILFLDQTQRSLENAANREKALLDKNVTDEVENALKTLKINTDLSNAIIGLLGLRDQAEREFKDKRKGFLDQQAVDDAKFLADALNKDLQARLDHLDTLEVLHQNNAKVLLGIEADRFRTQKQMYDSDVQDAIDAELQKTGMLKDKVAKQLAIQAGAINQVKQFRQQTIDNAATVLLQQARQAGDLGRAFQVGFANAATAAEDAFDLMARSGAEAFRSLGQGLSDFVFDTITGAKSIGDIFVDLGKRILRTMLDVFAQIAVRQAAMALGFNISTMLAMAGIAGAAGGVGGFEGSPNAPGSPVGGAGGGGFGGFLGIGNLFSGFSTMISSWLFEFLGSMVSNLTGELLPGAIGALGSLVPQLIGNVVPIVGSAIAVITNLLQGNIRGASLIGAGAIIGSFIPGIGTAIGAVIGGIIDFIVGLFEGPPTARLYAQFQSTFLDRQQDFLDKVVGSFGAWVSADMPLAEAIKLSKQIEEALSALLRQLLESTLKAQEILPSSITATMNARLRALADRSPMLAQGEREFNLEKPEELKAAIEALPNQVIKLFSEAIFGGLDLATLQKPGEELGETFARVLNSMVGLTQVVDLLGGDIEALVQSMGTGDEALAAFVQGSIAFFDQFAKEGEKFEDTLKRVMEGIGGLIQLQSGIQAKIAELTNDSALAIQLMVEQLKRGQEGLVRLADQLTVAIESGGAPDEVLKLAQALFEGRVRQFQAEIQFVQQLKGAVDQLRGAMLGALDTLGAILIASERFGGGGGDGRSLHPRLQFLAEGITLFRDLAGNVSGQIAVLNSAFQVLVGVLDGMIERGAQFGELADVFNIGFGTIHDGIVDILNTIQGLADPAQAVGALQQLGQAIIAGFDGAINTAKEFFDRQRSLAQDAASERIAQLNDERQAIQDSFSDQRSAIQDQRSLIEDRFKIERDALNEQIELTRQWASVLESVENQLRDLFNLMAPTQPLTSLQAVQDQFRAAFAAFQAGPTPELAQQVQTLGQQVIELAKGVPGFDLPSLAFQGVVDEVTAALEAIRSVAEAQPNEQDLLAQIAGIEQVQADSLASLDAQLAALDAAQQAALRGIDAQIVAVNQELQATLAALSQQEQEVIRFLEASAVAALDAVRVQLVARLAELQVAELQAAARLQEILGDKTFDEFIAGKQAQMVEQLSAIDATLKRYLGDITNRLFPGAGVPTAQFGMDYVPRTGPVLLHQGEMVLPRGEAEGVRRGEGEATVVVNLGGITVNAPGGGRVDAKRAVDEIEDELVRRFTFGKLRRPVLDITKRAPRA